MKTSVVKKDYTNDHHSHNRHEHSKENQPVLKNEYHTHNGDNAKDTVDKQSRQSSYAGHAEIIQPSQTGYTVNQPTQSEHAAHTMSERSEHTGHGESSHGDHAGHAGHAPEMFLKRFWLSLVLTVPILFYSEHIQMWLGFSAPSFPGSKYIPAFLGVFIYFYGGLVFVRNGIEELRNKQPGMMTLIGLAITVAFTNSVLVTLGIPGEELYWELATLVVIMLLGHWFEMNSVRGAQNALAEMAKLMPDTAWLVKVGGVKEVTVKSLHKGDLVLVRPGDYIPVDGEVVEGDSYVNESMVTGESAPVRKKPGEQVIAGTVNDDGSLRVLVRNTGQGTVLAGIMRLVEQAQASRSRAQVLADRAAFWLVLIAVSTAALTAIGWSIAQAGGSFIMERVVTVLVAACPHALGLAIPLVLAISTTLSARNGLLVKDRVAFEKARSLNYVVFDKTGTLTMGRHELQDIYAVPGMAENEVLRLAAAAEADSGHMISRGIAQAARKRKLTVPKAESFTSLAGRGVKALVEGQMVYVGGPNLLKYLGLTLPDNLQAGIKKAEESGDNITYLVIEEEVRGALTMADMIRSESREAVDALKKRGVSVAILTGDSEAVAGAVAGELGIDRYFAGVLPEHKAAKIEELQREGYLVAMVGDGVNDAPALATADVGIAIGAGTDVAVESAGIVLVRNDPRDVVRLIDISRATYRKMVQNLVWATGYNVVIIPLAAGVLAPVGFVLPMAVGAIVMSVSTVIVALNAQLLRQIKLNSI